METVSGSLIGMRLGRYLIDAYLGAGSAGQVYRALDMYLQRPVALKILHPHLATDRDRLERFFAEARAASVIRHEHIIEYNDMHQAGPGGLNYLVMELLEGRTLRRVIRDSGRLVPERAVFIAAQVASALEAAHRAGIVHRDLKPDNLFLIHRTGTEDYVKVLDFGVARLRPDLTLAKATRTGVLIGTPAYMSPEQCMGERATPAADIYALGVILFEMLTGQLPFDRRTIPRLLMAHVIEEPPLIPEVPIALSKLVAQALAKQPGKRPSSMATMRDAMLASMGMEAFATLRRKRSMTLSRAEQNWLAGIAAISALILGVRGFSLQHPPSATFTDTGVGNAGDYRPKPAKTTTKLTPVQNEPAAWHNPVAVAPVRVQTDEVTLEFSVTPQDAIVTVDGQPAEGGKLTLPAGTKSVAVRIEAEGYEPYEADVVPNRSKGIIVLLAKIAEPERGGRPRKRGWKRAVPEPPRP